ncbi:MAG: hypothetical protein QMB64_05595, partial [Pseudomonadales bacterium]
MNESFDIAIVGAGLAGTALACALSSAGSSTSAPLRIALIEAKTIKNDWPACDESIHGFDPRVSALTVASQAFLTDIGVWSAMTQ